MIRKLFSAAAIAVTLVSVSTAQADEAAGDTATATAADNILFPALVSVDGKNTPVHPSIGEGKWTVVMVWATTCHICEIDKPLYSEFHKKHKDGNIQVFGISIDGIANEPEVEEYLAKRDVSFPNSVGEFSTVSSAVVSIADEAVRGTPTYLLFNPEGEIVGVQAGHLDPARVEQFIEAS